MKVLVTGGCGFIGANLTALLRKRGIGVRVVDNMTLGRAENIRDPDVDIHVGDIRHPDVLISALHGVDAVIHLAADARVIPSIENPRFNFEVNVRGTFEVLMAMRKTGVTRLINASTGGAILGEAPSPVHEDIPAHPISPYGASKLAAEGYCDAFAGSYGFQCVSLRFSNVYGPHSRHKGSVVAAFMNDILRGSEISVYGDGSQVRDYIFVDDICEGIIRALESSACGVFQLGTGCGTSLNQLIDHLKAVVAPGEVEVRYLPARPGEISATYTSIEKARRVLGFQPQTSLHDGLAQTWLWFKSPTNEAMRA